MLDAKSDNHTSLGNQAANHHYGFIFPLWLANRTKLIPQGNVVILITGKHSPHPPSVGQEQQQAGPYLCTDPGRECEVKGQHSQGHRVNVAKGNGQGSFGQSTCEENVTGKRQAAVTSHCLSTLQVGMVVNCNHHGNSSPGIQRPTRYNIHHGGLTDKKQQPYKTINYWNHIRVE